MLYDQSVAVKTLSRDERDGKNHNQFDLRSVVLTSHGLGAEAS